MVITASLAVERLSTLSGFPAPRRLENRAAAACEHLEAACPASASTVSWLVGLMYGLLYPLLYGPPSRGESAFPGGFEIAPDLPQPAFSPDGG